MNLTTQNRILKSISALLKIENGNKFSMYISLLKRSHISNHEYRNMKLVYISVKKIKCKKIILLQCIQRRTVKALTSILYMNDNKGLFKK